jgi:hypothetical protein
MNEESTGHCENKISAPTALRTQTGLVYLLVLIFGIVIHIVKGYREDFRIRDAQIYEIFGTMFFASFIAVSYIAFKFADETVAEIRYRRNDFGRKWGLVSGTLLFILTISMLYYMVFNFGNICDGFIYRDRVREIMLTYTTVAGAPLIFSVFVAVLVQDSKK